MTKLRIGTILLMNCLTLSGCSSSETLPSDAIKYTCKNGDKIYVQYEQEKDQMKLWQDGSIYFLEPVFSGSGAQYAGQGKMFWSAGSNTLFNPNGENAEGELIECGEET